MTNEFIHPNWHVIVLHFPIALLTTGIIIEWLGLIGTREGFRGAGRWMVLLGALLAVPAATTGLYAFRDEVVRGPLTLGMDWSAVVQQSHWNDAQWELISDHILFNSIAAVIFLVVVVLWLGGNREWRQRAYWPMTIALLVALALMTVGAWHGGEMVYRYGTGVAALDQTADAATPQTTGIEYYISSLQLHLTLAGLLLAIAVGSLAVSWRVATQATAEIQQRGYEVAPPGEPPHGSAEPQVPIARPWRYWLAALVAGLLTALAGIWAVTDAISVDALEHNWQELFEPSHLRLLLHAIVGVSVIVLTFILIFVANYLKRHRSVVAVFLALLLIAAAVQVWLGILMLFDSHSGPLLGFGPAAQAAPIDEGEAAEPSPATTPAAPEVGMTNQLEFIPKRIAIDAGQTVLWKNTSDIPHTVTADPAQAIRPQDHVQLPEGAETFDSGTMQPGDTFRHTFTVPGLYRYFCVPHEMNGMVGEVEVRQERPAAGEPEPR